MSTKRAVIGVIDDNLPILSALGRLLSALEYDTELYTSPKEFLESAITTEAIGLIVDIQLGDDCGIEFVRQFSNTGSTLPIIFMTGNHDESIKRRAQETGCAAYLLKPFSSQDLIQALAKFPSRRRSPHAGR